MQLQTTETLNKLIALNLDAINGYEEVSKTLDSKILSTWLADYAKKRHEFVEELQSYIITIGGQPNTENTLLGTIHLLWINLKDNWTNSAPSPLLEECIRGEESIMETYNEAIKSEHQTNKLQKLLNNQRDYIRKAIDDLKQLAHIFDNKKTL